MKKFIKNYKSTLILLGAIIVGTIVGLIFGEKTKILSPFGDLFLNLLLVIIIPLIFLTISTSIGRMEQPKRIGKILAVIIGVFLVTSVVSCFVGIGTTKMFNLVKLSDTEAIKEVLAEEVVAEEAEEVVEPENEEVAVVEETVE
jgi:Na+/H+-dicarboxylate symporter